MSFAPPAPAVAPGLLMVGLLIVQIVVVFFLGEEPRKRRLEELDAVHPQLIFPETRPWDGIAKK